MEYKRNRFKELFTNVFVIIGIAYLLVLALFIYGTIHPTKPALSEIQHSQARYLWYKNSAIRTELEHRRVKRLADYLEQYHHYRLDCGYVQGKTTWFESEERFEEFVKEAQLYDQCRCGIVQISQKE